MSERPGTSSLFDQRLNLLERGVIGAAQPFEGHHLGRHQFRAIAGQSVEGRIEVALGARTAGIGYHPHLELLLQQFKRGLQQADMGFAARDNEAVALRIIGA